MKRLLGWGAFAFIAIALVACGIGQPRGQTGAIELRLANNVPNFSFAPTGAPMVVTSYTIEGTGPAGAVLAQQAVTDGMTIMDLVPGPWTFLVRGLDADGVEIGTGTSGTVNVVIGQVKPANVMVHEHTGPGTLDVLVGWEPDIVSWPLWEAHLYDKDADEATLAPFTVYPAELRAESLDNAEEKGFYALIVKLWNAPNGVIDGDAVLSTGAATVVRIAKGRETIADFGVLHSVQGYGGIEVTIGNDIEGELILESAEGGPFGNVSIEGTTAFRATAPGASVFSYYLRGTQVYVGAEAYTMVVTDLTPGETYRLDVLGWTNDGKKAGSACWNITRLEADPLTLDVRGTLSRSVAHTGEGILRAELYDGLAPSGEPRAEVETTGLSVDFNWTWLPGADYTLRTYQDTNSNGVCDGTEWNSWNCNEVQITIPHGSGVTYSREIN